MSVAMMVAGGVVVVAGAWLAGRWAARSCQEAAAHARRAKVLAMLAAADRQECERCAEECRAGVFAPLDRMKAG